MGSVGNNSNFNESDIVSAIQKFTSDKYKEIRKASIGEKITSVKFDIKTKTRKTIDVTNTYKRDSDILESYIRNSNTKDTLYRGITVDDDTLDSFKIGKIIDQQGISSWSKLESSALSFGKENQQTPNKILFVETGGTKKGRDISDSSLASKMDKNEVIQSVTNKQKIKKIEKKNGITYIYVVEV